MGLLECASFCWLRPRQLEDKEARWFSHIISLVHEDTRQRWEQEDNRIRRLALLLRAPRPQPQRERRQQGTWQTEPLAWPFHPAPIFFLTLCCLVPADILNDSAESKDTGDSAKYIYKCQDSHDLQTVNRVLVKCQNSTTL